MSALHEQFNGTYDNPMGTNGFAFLEFSPVVPENMEKDFRKLGFSNVARHATMAVDHYQQGDIHFFINKQRDSRAERFARVHGSSVSGMGFKVEDADYAFNRALRLGARAYQGELGPLAFDVPAIYGIGESILYLVDEKGAKTIHQHNFKPTMGQSIAPALGLFLIDHVTHNVYRGQLDEWANYYERLFNFREIRYFDIQGEQTGLTSRAMTSPCNKIRIPLNQSSDEQSQIEEYLKDYNGPGIQHIALATHDIYTTIEQARLGGIRFLKVPDTYYEQVEERVPKHGEDLVRMQRNKILIDGNAQNGEGILLQIFTGNMIGPVFFEVIQRKGNEGFGHGNFRALFVSMELDQIRRGVLKPKQDKK